MLEVEGLFFEREIRRVNIKYAKHFTFSGSLSQLGPKLSKYFGPTEMPAPGGRLPSFLTPHRQDSDATSNYKFSHVKTPAQNDETEHSTAAGASFIHYDTGLDFLGSDMDIDPTPVHLNLDQFPDNHEVDFNDLVKVITEMNVEKPNAFILRNKKHRTDPRKSGDSSSHSGIRPPFNSEDSDFNPELHSTRINDPHTNHESKNEEKDNEH